MGEDQAEASVGSLFVSSNDGTVGSPGRADDAEDDVGEIGGWLEQ
jgi:hypothetical protein